MAGDRKRTLPMLFGSRPHAVVRLRGWERYAFVAALLAVTATGGLSLATQLGAAPPSGLLNAVGIVTGAAVAAAVVATLRAMNRYDGELNDTPPSPADRLIARLTHRT